MEQLKGNFSEFSIGFEYVDLYSGQLGQAGAQSRKREPDQKTSSGQT